MKQTLVTILCFFIALNSFSQKKYGIKIYQNTDFFQKSYYESAATITTDDIINFDRFSVAFNVILDNGLMHEMEIFIPEISKSSNTIKFPFNYTFRNDNSFKTEVSSYSLRYELNKSILKASSRFGLSLGLGLNPYFLELESIPKVSNAYSARKNYFGIALNLTTRMQYQLTRRLIIDLNFPLKIYDLRWEQTKIENPLIPRHHQITKDFEAKFFEDVYTMRLGIMYVIFSK